MGACPFLSFLKCFDTVRRRKVARDRITRATRCPRSVELFGVGDRLVADAGRGRRTWSERLVEDWRQCGRRRRWGSAAPRRSSCETVQTQGAGHARRRGSRACPDRSRRTRSRARGAKHVARRETNVAHRNKARAHGTESRAPASTHYTRPSTNQTRAPRKSARLREYGSRRRKSRRGVRETCRVGQER